MNKYPRAEKFLQETGMTIDEALEYLEKKEGEDRNVRTGTSQ